MEEKWKKKMDPKTDKLIKQFIYRSAIRQDLMDSIKCVKLAIARSNDLENIDKFKNRPEELIIMNSIWQSCVLHYTRCFASSPRGKIDLNSINKVLNNDMIKLHKEIINLRNNYVAHNSGEPENQNFNVFAVIYSDENDPSSITYTIKGCGTRTVGFDKKTYQNFLLLFELVFRWYTDKYVQPITDKLSEKYYQPHCFEFNPKIQFKKLAK